MASRTTTRGPGGAPPVLTLSSTLDLRSTLDLVAARDRHVGLRHREVVVDLPGLEPVRSAESAARLTDLLDECGCDTGARAMLAAGAVSLAGLLVLTDGPMRALALSPLAVLAVVTGAGAGKAYGLLRSRRAFRRELTRLLADAGLQPGPQPGVQPGLRTAPTDTGTTGA